MATHRFWLNCYEGGIFRAHATPEAALLARHFRIRYRGRYLEPIASCVPLEFEAGVYPDEAQAGQRSGNRFTD